MTDCQILFLQILPGLSTRYLEFNPTLTTENCCEYDSRQIRCEGSRISTIILTDSTLDGRLPPEIGSLDFLQTLVLSNNLLQGDIPVEIGLLTKLNALFLDQNPSLTGTVPPALANIDSLQYLDLKATGLRGPLAPAFAKKTFVSGTLGSSSCPYDRSLCTGPSPPRQAGCENICLQIAFPVIFDHNGPGEISTAAPTISTETETVVTSATTAPTIFVTDNSTSSSNSSYLNYVIPISIAAVCAILALIYRYGRRNYIVGGKQEVNGSIQSLGGESTAIRASEIDRDRFGGFRIEMDEGDLEEELVAFPQKDYVPKLFEESKVESEVEIFMRQLKEQVSVPQLEPRQEVIEDPTPVQDQQPTQPEKGKSEYFTIDSFYSFGKDS
jgi:hypothetical protein